MHNISMTQYLAPQEQEAYRLLFDEKLSAREASERLAQKGIKRTPKQLIEFKNHLFKKIVDEERKERQAEYALESYDKVKIEFEDLLNRTKQQLKQLDNLENFNKYDSWKQNALLERLERLITLALKKQGKLEKGTTSIHAKNVNVLNVSDMAQAFKKTLEKWFTDMDVSYENGKFIFNKPTPELIDDYNQWKAKHLRKPKTIEAESKEVVEDANQQPTNR